MCRGGSRSRYPQVIYHDADRLATDELGPAARDSSRVAIADFALFVPAVQHNANGSVMGRSDPALGSQNSRPCSPPNRTPRQWPALACNPWVGDMSFDVDMGALPLPCDGGTDATSLALDPSRLVLLLWELVHCRAMLLTLCRSLRLRHGILT